MVVYHLINCEARKRGEFLQLGSLCLSLDRKIVIFLQVIPYQEGVKWVVNQVGL